MINVQFGANLTKIILLKSIVSDKNNIYIFGVQYVCTH